MRRKQRKREPGERRVAEEPMAEGIVPLDSRGRRFWSSMSDGELVGYTRAFIAERGIRGRSGLQETDNSLYQALSKRGLLDGIGLKSKHRDWASMDDRGLSGLARRFIAERGIVSRKNLRKEDAGMYQALRKRGLLGGIGLEDIYRDWASMGDWELLCFARRFIAERRIGLKVQLKRADQGLYYALIGRKLLDGLGIGRKLRNWAAMSDQELVAYARENNAERGIHRRKGLENSDPRLYNVLRRRELLDAVFADIDRSKETEGVRDVVKALGEF